MSGRNAPRSRTGCSTCRIRKVKCDEARPCCRRCKVAKLGCEWQVMPRRQRLPRTKAIGGQIQPLRHLVPRVTFSLSTNLDLRNSLRLSSIDQEYLHFFPHTSVVKTLGKPWKWSILSYLHSRVASESPTIMRLILAISARHFEMRPSIESNGGSLSRHFGASVSHYNAALREFRTELERSRPSCDDDVDRIVATFFLLNIYEYQFGQGLPGLQMHLAGLYAFLASYKASNPSDSDVLPDLPVLSQNILLYIMYLHFAYYWGYSGKENSSPIPMQQDLFCTVIDELFQGSRDTNSIIWCDEYPTEELADDISVYHPLEFCHECSKLKHKLLCYTKNAKFGQEQTISGKTLLGELGRVGKRFHYLVKITQRVNPPIRLRELQTIYFAVVDYYALELLSHRAICIPQAHNNRLLCHQDSLKNLLSVLRKLQESDSAVMGRVIWPLLVAAEFTDNVDDQRWTQKVIDVIPKGGGTREWLGAGLQHIG